MLHITNTFQRNNTKHTVLMRKSKDWLVRNQDNVSEWGDMFIYKNPTQRVGLEHSGPHHRLIEN
jgi:hypothetical protein